MLDEECLDPAVVDSVDFSQPSESFRCGHCLRAAKRLVWMLLEHPGAELAVIFTRAKSVAAPNKRALLAHNHAAHPGVVTCGSARELRL